jgi:hypothetical protein
VTIKGKIVHIIPKWYIVVLANKICCTPIFVLDIMVTFKTEKVLEMSSDRIKMEEG